MKPKLDNKYFKICVYVVCTAIAIYLAIMVIHSVPTIYRSFVSIVSLVVNILKPLIIGLVIAYILYAPTNGIANFLDGRKHLRIKSRKLQKMIGILVSYIVIIGVIILLLWGIYFMIGGQFSQHTSLSNVLQYITSYFEKNSFSQEGIKEQIASLGIPFLENLDEHISKGVVFIQDVITQFMDSFLASLLNLGSNIFSIFIALILSIYLLYDSEYFFLLWRKFFFVIFRNTKTGTRVKKAFSIINDTFSGYIKGQLIEALVVAVLSTLVLLVIGIDYALLIGIISGLFNLIPYIGPVIGTILAAIIALLSGDPWKTLWVVLGMIVVQQLDSNVFAPRVVGQSVGLHPLFIMIAIIIGGSWGGLLGMLIAVPIAASCKKLVAIWYNIHFQEEFIKSTDKKEVSQQDDKD